MKSKKKKKRILDDRVVNIKVENKEQIISRFSYDENDKLNKDLSEFIVEKTKGIQSSQEVKLNFYTKTSVDKTEVKKTIQNHFKEEYAELKRELKRANVFILVMFIFGLVTLAISVALHNHGFNNFYFEMVLEIASWVFIWEAVDRIFIARPRTRRRCTQMQKLQTAEVKIIVDDKANSYTTGVFKK